MIADLPADGARPGTMQAGLSLAPLSLSMLRSHCWRGRGGDRPAYPRRLALVTVGVLVLIPVVPPFGWAFVIPLMIAGTGLGLLVSQLRTRSRDLGGG
jgi:hypothetical protein